MIKKILIASIALLTPLLISADGGMVVWPPEVHLNQEAQNAIVAWNQGKEIIILSNDIQSNASSTALRIVPLPSEPKIEEGSFESFEVLVETMNQKLELMRKGPPGLGKEAGQGVEITFQKKIGAHDITVVKVNDLNEFLSWIKNFAEDKQLSIKQISFRFRQGISNYLKRGINYFAFDLIEAKQKQSIKPLSYNFDSNCLFYPILISGVSEVGSSESQINLFLITDKKAEIPNPPYRRNWFGSYGYPVELSQEELLEISEGIASLFDNGVKVRKASLYGRLNEITRDLMLYPYSWNQDLSIGNKGKQVKALQKILINEGVWDSKAEATGYFGPITKNALIEFQEKYKEDILEPIGLEQGTGYFGKKTRNYLKRLSITGVQPELRIEWTRNLGVGMRGDEVKKLQRILIEEGVWNRPDVNPTGYFGFITKKAVIRFQEKHFEEILKPLELEKGTGFVGPSTRSYLKTRDLKETKEKDLTYCKTDQDCVLVNSNCCPCSMGGSKKCINKDYQEQWKEELNCKADHIICPAVYLCDSLPSRCECLNNSCQTVQ